VCFAFYVSGLSWWGFGTLFDTPVTPHMFETAAEAPSAAELAVFLRKQEPRVKQYNSLRRF
jgi:hypothetical protein